MLLLLSGARQFESFKLRLAGRIESNGRSLHIAEDVLGDQTVAEVKRH
jgi:hypothetical protein